MEWKDSATLVLPLVYVVNSNITQLVERREQAPSPIAIAASEQLRRFSEYPNHSGECSLFPAVRDLLMNFTMPNETPIPQSQQISNQIAQSPVGQLGSSPNPMLQHSPMQSMNQVGGNVNGGTGNQPSQMYGMGPNQVSN